MTRIDLGRSSVSLIALAATFALIGCSAGSGTPTPTPTPTPTASLPGAPTIGTAAAGDTSASISFSAPASNGGAAISGYTASCSGGSTATGAASPITVTGLINGVTYTCTVNAANSVGTGPVSASVSVTPAPAAPGVSTASVDCPYSVNTLNPTIGLTSIASWTCNTQRRFLVANGIPDHPVGTFPNANNPNAISAQSVSFSATVTPVAATVAGTNPMQLGYARNGVKFDPGTAGSCPSGATSVMQCGLTDNTGAFRIEALGQTTFNFGTDTNNAHVQPGGAYHYHGMPEGLLTAAGATATAPKMVLVGHAPDGYPVYARFGRSVPADVASPLKVMRGSYTLKTTPDAGRPAISVVPMGAFLQDYEYVAGSGDLDECNGRFDVTPEFPAGIYHYYATDSYPYLPRCWKGVVN